MRIWYLEDLQRLSAERTAIEALEKGDWLSGVDWSLSREGELRVDATVSVHGCDYELQMIYPALFPAVPPIVRPKDPSERWSEHQYLSGTLCLEWGPDNWRPDVSGAQMIESAYRLLKAENPKGSQRMEAVPSRHSPSLGETLRGRYMRGYVGDPLRQELAGLQDVIGLFQCTQFWHEKTSLLLAYRMADGDARIVEDTEVPEAVRSPMGLGLSKLGVFLTRRCGSDAIEQLTKISDVRRLITGWGFDAEEILRAQAFPGNTAAMDVTSLLLLDEADQPHLFLVMSDGDLWRVELLPSESGVGTCRVPSEMAGLRTRSVGIVGLGSVGGKMAVSLARTGVGELYLVDGDVFVPGNVSRHVLDWTSVGEHKVDAIREAVLRVSATKVDTGDACLTGQESTSYLSKILSRLAKCDLVIDATANPEVLNLLAAVAQTYDKPLVWLEVFAGGIGGMIARSRPGKDPSPYVMRGLYHEFLSKAPKPELADRQDYAAETAEGQTVVATDADVGVIADHATRMVIDTVLSCEPSGFPYSMYLIGLARAWLFAAPFDTLPIDTTGVTESSCDAASNPSAQSHDIIPFVAELIRRYRESSAS